MKGGCSVLKRLRRESQRTTCLASLCVLLLLSACKPSQLLDEDSRLPREVTGVNDQTILEMEKLLRHEGIRVISEGDQYLVSVPAKYLFAEQSPRLTWKSFKLLNDLACYLRLFRKVGVEVSAYTSKYASVKREHALSLARAQAVADYLWSQRIETRFLFSHGHGRDKPIVLKAPQGDNSPNARI